MLEILQGVVECDYALHVSATEEFSRRHVSEEFTSDPGASQHEAGAKQDIACNHQRLHAGFRCKKQRRGCHKGSATHRGDYRHDEKNGFHHLSQGDGTFLALGARGVELVHWTSMPFSGLFLGDDSPHGYKRFALLFRSESGESSKLTPKYTHIPFTSMQKIICDSQQVRHEKSDFNQLD